MSDGASANSTPDRRRWLILGVIGLAQLMVILDLTVMNIALPSAQRALLATSLFVDSAADLREEALARLGEHLALPGCSILRG